jgi:hypothetical protein
MDPLLLRKCGSAGNRNRTSGSVARNSDHQTRGNEEVHCTVCEDSRAGPVPLSEMEGNLFSWPQAPRCVGSLPTGSVLHKAHRLPAGMAGMLRIARRLQSPFALLFYPEDGDRKFPRNGTTRRSLKAETTASPKCKGA